MNTILLVLAGVLAGIVSGMGIGGGAVLIPALTTFFGMSQIAAQNINLLYFAPTAAAAVIVHMRNRRIKAKTALPIMIFGACGAVLGAILALGADMAVLRKLFGGFLLIMGIVEFFKKN